MNSEKMNTVTRIREHIFSDEPISPLLSTRDHLCEGLLVASQVDTTAPRFSWKLSTESEKEKDLRQTAYQLRIRECSSGGYPLGDAFETERIESENTLWVEAPRFRAKTRSYYAWQVRVWDNKGRASDWSLASCFGTGLIGEKWAGKWISDGRNLSVSERRPARHFRGKVDVDKPIVRARLYLSALGLVEPWLNGEKVTEDAFLPGWPDYRRRVLYVAYDVTEHLRQGSNTLGMLLADGWYSGTLMPGFQFGKEAMFSAFLDLVDEDGIVSTVSTDDTWRWTDTGPIVLNSIYDGETYDANKELNGWCDADAEIDEEAWRPALVRDGWHGETVPQAYTARMAPPVRRIECLDAREVNRTGEMSHIVDFGQNLAGWVKLKVGAKAGQRISIRFAEMLESDGFLHIENLRTAKATAEYIAKGQGTEEWEPRFTYFGFRYIEISGLEDLEADTVSAVVVHADMPMRGNFECSKPLLNKLWQNTLWGQRGNFLEVPTDCPQRDERVGWTGDAQIFAPTALYNMDSGNFLRQWLFAVRDGVRDGPEGGVPDIAPYTGFFHGSAGWAEAGIIVPWTIYCHTGDRRVLEENFASIQYQLELMAAQAPDGIRKSKASYGDWLSPGFDFGKYPPRYELVATAYFAYAARLASRIAEALGRSEVALANRSLFHKSRAAFQREYIDSDGRVADDVQASYLFALAFDLVPDQLREKAAAHLERTIAEKDNHLATGFLGTPLLAPVLSEIGRTDLAYTVLQQTSYPGWLFSVVNGATTVWERWDSWTPENGFHKDGMNSFNHYAYGSVVSWFYETIAGLQLLPDVPAWRRFRIAPQPGGGLEHASASIDTPYGQASSAWRIEEGRFLLSVTIPPNTSAEVVFDLGRTVDVSMDGSSIPGSLSVRDEDLDIGKSSFILPSGSYRFSAKWQG